MPASIHLFHVVVVVAEWVSEWKKLLIVAAAAENSEQACKGLDSLFLESVSVFIVFNSLQFIYLRLICSSNYLRLDGKSGQGVDR